MDRLLGVLSIGLLAVIASVSALDRLHLYAIYASVFAVFGLALAFFISIFHRGMLKVFERPFRALGWTGVERAITRFMDDLHGFKHQGGTLAVARGLDQVRWPTHVLWSDRSASDAAGYYFLFVPVLAALVSLDLGQRHRRARGGSVVLFQPRAHARASFTVPFITYVISV
jgi:hypothetical protein